MLQCSIFALKKTIIYGRDQMEESKQKPLQ